MAVAVAINRRDTEGARHTREVTLTFSGTYSAGGEALTPRTALELPTKVDRFDIPPQKGFSFEWDGANNKVKIYALSVAGGAAAAGTDALSIKANVLSKEAAGVAAAPLRELGATQSLTPVGAITGRAVGY